MRSLLRPFALAVAATLLLVTGCAAAPESQVALPPAGASPDYQLGGAYDPPAGVGVVARDRSADPADGIYSICYINAFQTQPDERDVWTDDLLLHNDDGTPLVDPVWPDELLIDTSTAEKRDAIVELVDPWIRGCAESGFDAIEFDNLDSFTRSGDALTEADNTVLASALVTIAHESGLAAGQKNAAEFSNALRDQAGFDFAVAEECVAFDECALYTEVYGEHVIAIEYSDTLEGTFAEACADAATSASVVLRDRDLLARDDPGYVFELC